MPGLDGRSDVSGLTARAPSDMRWPYSPPEEVIVQRMLGDRSSQDAYYVLADMTGGLFQHDNNDLFGQVRRAIDDTDGYYLIGWYPGRGAFDSKPKHQPAYHRIQIKVSGKDVTVRSRRGYFAIPGTASPPVFYTAAQQMHDALFSPFRSGDIDIRLTASFAYDKQTGPYVESLLRVWPRGISFHDVPTQPGCKAANLELLATPMPLDWRPETKGRIDGVHSALQLCGKTLTGVLAEGFIVVDRQPIGLPGTYQMRTSLRNVLPSEPSAIAPQGLIERDSLTAQHVPIGSATELVEIPDLSKQEFALVGLSLWSGDAPQQPTQPLTYRGIREGDPAVREFRPGDLLTYATQVVRGFKNRTSAPIAIRTKVLCAGQEVFSSAPSAAAFDEVFTGAYRLPASTAPSRCVLGIVVHAEGKNRAIEQWIDFEVRN